jgi:hypothetical protein
MTMRSPTCTSAKRGGRSARCTSGIAHGALDDLHLVVLSDGGAAIGTFNRATAAASPAQLATDRAQLLVTTALPSGRRARSRRRDRARNRRPRDDALPQSAALTRPIRAGLKASPTLLDDLRSATAAARHQVPKADRSGA